MCIWEHGRKKTVQFVHSRKETVMEWQVMIAQEPPYGSVQPNGTERWRFDTQIRSQIYSAGNDNVNGKVECAL
jgi:hypothetical protein